MRGIKVTSEWTAVANPEGIISMSSFGFKLKNVSYCIIKTTVE